MRLQDRIRKPSLIVNPAQVERNIARMALRCREAGAVFRPHFKTHQSGLIGELFRAQGVDRIAVSSVAMASYFAHHAWEDITIAFPFNPREIPDLAALQQLARLKLVTASPDTLRHLQQKLTEPVDLYLKTDVGYGRSGIDADHTDVLKELAEISGLSPKTRLSGLLSHAGNTYHFKGLNEIQQIADEGRLKLSRLRKALDPELILSWGDTPSCSKAAMQGYFDEWRPGNFVFYDLMQYHLGVCQLNDIAVAVACPVVEVQKHKNRLIIHGGAVHFSKESIEADTNFKLFGYVVRFTEQGWTSPIAGCWLSSLSQEHGIVQTSAGMNDIKVGDIIGILPVHSCLTVSAFREMYSLNGDLIPCMKD